MKDNAQRWIVKLGRFGYAAKGIVYIVIGILAINLAAGARNTKVGSEQALKTIVQQPMGQILLAIVGIGLAGYMIWKLSEAIVDPEHNGTDPKGLVKRAGDAASGIGYGSIAFSAFQILIGHPSNAGGKSPQGWTAMLMSHPWGRYAVIAAGLFAAGIAFSNFYIAYKTTFKDKLKTGGLDENQVTMIERLGQLGYGARGVVLLIIAYFLIEAAWTYDPKKAGGLTQALRALADQPYGVWLLGIVAAGFVAYGVLMIVMARYKRIYLD
jgi:putative flippase GtrA